MSRTADDGGSWSTGVLLLALLVCLGLPAAAQQVPVVPSEPSHVRACGDQGSAWLEELLASDSRLATVAESPEEHRLQLIVWEVVSRASEGDRCLRRHSYRAGAEYFYPASAIKIVASVAALQVLDRLDERAGLDSRITIDPLAIPHPGGLGYEPEADPETERDVLEITPGLERATLRDLISDALIISSNPAYNALYDIAGAEALNRQMWALGLDSVRVSQRFSLGFVDWVAHQWRPRVVVDVDGRGVELHDAHLDAAVPPSEVPGLLVGRAYRGPDRQRIREPLDFAPRNAASIQDLLHLLRALVDPGLGRDPLRLELDESERLFLVEAMTAIAEPEDDETPDERDARLKPLLPGVLRVIPDREQIRYVSKIGQAYGFITDIAYIEHTATGRAFYVGVTLYVNPNDILNDNRYAYDDVGFPFLQDLGEVLARELLLD